MRYLPYDNPLKYGPIRRHFTLWDLDPRARRASYEPPSALKPLLSLEGKESFDYALTHSEEIKTPQDLLFALENIPPSYRTRLSLLKNPLINNFDDAINVIRLIPAEDRFEIAYVSADSIKTERNLWTIISHMPLEKRMKFAQLNQSLLSDYFRESYLSRHYLGVTDFLILFPMNDHSACFSYLLNPEIDLDKMDDFCMFICNLKSLEASKRLDFAMTRPEIITGRTEKELNEFIALLPEDDQLKFVRSQKSDDGEAPGMTLAP